MSSEVVAVSVEPVEEAGLAGAVCSMTGYARVVSRAEDACGLAVTLKSMNHRFLDLQIRLPAGAESVEGMLRAELKRALARGHVECTMTLDRAADRAARRDVGGRSATVRFDSAALAGYVQSFRAAAKELGLASEPDLNIAAQLPGMLVAASAEVEEGDPEARARLEAMLAREAPALLAAAIDALKEMRAHEGRCIEAVAAREPRPTGVAGR